MSSMRPDVVIEAPVWEDVDALASLFHQDMEQLGIHSTFEQKSVFAKRVVEAQGLENPELVCFVARIDGERKPAGVILGNFYWSIKFSGRCVWIEGLYVSPRVRRRGLGRVLVEALLDWAEACGVPGVDIEAYRGNTPASVLYRTVGFRRLGRERFNIALGD